MVRIGDLELGTVPRVAVALSDAEIRDGARSVATLVDVFELRIDRFSRHDPEYVAHVTGVARSLGVPLLATIRSPGEGGEAALTDAERLALLRVVIPWVDAVDIELGASIRDDVIVLAHRHAKPVVASMHDFDSTPTLASLLAHVATGRTAGADIVKLATTIHTPADLVTLLDALRASSDQPMIVIGMGPAGLASRVFFPLLGSALTWGFLNTVGAPGQMQVADLVDELSRYAPAFARRHGRL